MATIEEIARRAKVSKTLVSFVINGKPGVSARTAAHIRRVMAEMDYVPSALAQRFASQRSMAVALIARSYPRVFHDPRHAEIVDAVYQTLEENDYTLVLGTSNRRFLQAKKHITLLRSGQVDGLLVLEPTLDEPYLTDLTDADKPVVLVNSDGSPFGLDYVRTDDVAVGRLAAEHLLALGHRRIGLLAGQETHASARDRSRGFREALADAGCPLSETRVFRGEYDASEASGHDGCRLILERAPETTAIFCCNDTMALAAMEAAAEQNRPVPQTLSLLGVDDHPACVVCRPQLSSIRQPSFDMARLATTMLIERLRVPPAASREPQCRLLSPTVVPRDSCAPPGGSTTEALPGG
jgi:LacI family transcriptional regulator